MSIAFPALPRTADIKPRLIRYGTDLTPALGGPVARTNRMGSRYAVDVTLPTLDRDQGPIWVGARLAAEATNSTNVLVMPSAYYEAFIGVEVSGGGQAGSNLGVKGLPNNAAIPALIPFSFFTGGRNYLHLTTSEVTSDGGGNAVLTIAPMLRIVPADSLGLNFEAPVIEGFCSGSSIDWQLQLARFHKISFTLTENA